MKPPAALQMEEQDHEKIHYKGVDPRGGDGGGNFADCVFVESSVSSSANSDWNSAGWNGQWVLQ
jgi:hypothetical protein